MSIYRFWPGAHYHFNVARGILPAASATVRSIHPAHLQTFSEPKHIESSTEPPLDLYQASAHQPETSLLCVERGWCHPSEVILTREGYLLHELLGWHGAPQEHPVLNRVKWFPRHSHFQGTVLHLALPSHDNYFHWICDALPLLYACQNERVSIDAIYLKRTHPFQSDYLRRLHFDHIPQIDGAVVGLLQADRVIGWTHKGFHPPNDWVLEILQKQLVPEIIKGLSTSEKGKKKIYLSREGVTGRELINECEVWNFLKARGFEKLHPHEMTVEEQIGAFRLAEVIAGAHGAAFTNLIYCRQGTKIIEFISMQYLDKTFQRLASHFALDYHLLLGEGTPQIQPDYWTANRSPLSISITKLEQLLSFYSII